MTPNGLYAQADRICPPRLCGRGGDAPRLRQFRRQLRRKQRPLRFAATISTAANASAADLRAAVDAMSRRADVTTQGMIALGLSAGGFASIALSADPPPGLAAVINFAGGRGSRADDDVCDEAALVRAFAAMGKTSRIPMLWVYAEQRQVLRARTGAPDACRLHRAPAAVPASSTRPPSARRPRAVFRNRGLRSGPRWSMHFLREHESRQPRA